MFELSLSALDIGTFLIASPSMPLSYNITDISSAIGEKTLNTVFSFEYIAPSSIFAHSFSIIFVNIIFQIFKTVNMLIPPIFKFILVIMPEKEIFSSADVKPMKYISFEE